MIITDPEATVKEILETLADRAAIEQYFHDLKEVWGAGQQQVRCQWTNIGAYHLNLWIHCPKIRSMQQKTPDDIPRTTSVINIMAVMFFIHPLVGAAV